MDFENRRLALQRDLDKMRSVRLREMKKPPEAPAASAWPAHRRGSQPRTVATTSSWTARATKPTVAVSKIRMFISSGLSGAVSLPERASREGAAILNCKDRQLQVQIPQLPSVRRIALRRCGHMLQSSHGQDPRRSVARRPRSRREPRESAGADPGGIGLLGRAEDREGRAGARAGRHPSRCGGGSIGGFRGAA